MKRNPISKRTFLKAVKHEIDAIKENATTEEINKLNIRLFNPDEKDNCIYGQLTKSCESDRAKELMEKACIKIFNVVEVKFLDGNNYNELTVHAKILKYKNQTWNKADAIFTRNLNYLSALETYILLKNANNGDIIKYLKGETTELNLDTIK